MMYIFLDGAWCKVTEVREKFLQMVMHVHTTHVGPLLIICHSLVETIMFMRHREGLEIIRNTSNNGGKEGPTKVQGEFHIVGAWRIGST